MTFTKTNNREYSRRFPNVWDNIFNDFDRAFGQPAVTSNIPANVVETEEAFHLELSAPGRNKDLFTLNLEEGLLTIGYTEPKATEEKTALKFVRKEFGVKSFKRSFSLDDKVDADNIQAKYEDGLLKILLPKKAIVKPQTKQITVL
ncbi:MAG TPA: Hsp20/alpha crystallin family protein [Phnomibacter sp.]|nr:Hsp20/alpha crystallin family protein [Phnomibacter sp.]